MAGVKITECTIFLVFTIFAVEVCSHQYDLVKVRSLFIDNLIDTIGSDAGISLEDIEEYFSRHNLKWVEQSTVDECFNDDPGNFSVDAKCLLEKCLDPSDVYNLSGLNNGSHSETEISTLSAILLHLLEKTECVMEGTVGTTEKLHNFPSSAEGTYSTDTVTNENVLYDTTDNKVDYDSVTSGYVTYNDISNDNITFEYSSFENITTEQAVLDNVTTANEVSTVTHNVTLASDSVTAGGNVAFTTDGKQNWFFDDEFSGQDTDTDGKNRGPAMTEAWGYGILCTTVINMCALTGVIALPFIRGDLYKKMLIYMVGLAVGTLAGSSLLFLIPEALELTDQELNHESYVWKCLVVISGIYIFFNIERCLKMITEARERARLHKTRRLTVADKMDFSSFHARRYTVQNDCEELDLQHTLPQMLACGGTKSSLSSTSDNDENSIQMANGSVEKENMKEQEQVDNSELITKTKRKRHHHSHGGHRQVEPVAWMIIFGDGLHNFIDGVSIGAAFTESILAGVSVSVAILCEELPHELGDFAVLLNAGMKVKKAVLYNFLSACMCYLGLIVGIFLGEMASTHTWVFAFAGGMFLYIALVDMMPEMNDAAEVDENANLSASLIFFLQNIGMLSGFGLMLLMAIYGGSLENAIRGES